MDTKEEYYEKHDWKQAHGVKEGILLLKQKVHAVAIDCRDDSGSDVEKDLLPLEQVLLEHTKLKAFQLYNYNLHESADLRMLILQLQTSKHLDYIGLFNNRIQDDGTTMLGHYLNHRKHIHCLDLHGNLITSKGCMVLSKAVEIHHHLKVLNLSYNRIGDEGMISLGNAVENNTHLCYLNLQGNECESVGALSFARALEKNTTLKYLNLSENPKIPAHTCDVLHDIAREKGVTFHGPKHTLHDGLNRIKGAIKHVFGLDKHKHDGKNIELDSFDHALDAAKEFTAEIHEQNEK